MVSNSSNNYVENFRIDFVYFGGNSITELSLLRTLVYDIPTDKLQVKQACLCAPAKLMADKVQIINCHWWSPAKSQL